MRSLLTIALTTDTTNFNDVMIIGEMKSMVDRLMSLNIVLTTFKFFKYARKSKNLSLILYTIQDSADQMLFLLIVVVVFIAGYGVAYFLAFSHQVYEFRTFTYSVLNLAYGMFGEFGGYDETFMSNSYIAATLYLTYSTFIHFGKCGGVLIISGRNFLSLLRVPDSPPPLPNFTSRFDNHPRYHQQCL